MDWSEVRFRDETEWPRLSEDDLQKEKDSNKNTTQAPAVPGRDQQAEHGFSQASVLFQTKFTNNTKDDQEYTLKVIVKESSK